MYMVNLLPWRLHRQRQRNRFWGGVTLATALVLLLMTLLCRHRIQTEQRIVHLRHDADATLLAALNQRHAERMQAQLKTEHVTQQVTLRQHYQQTHVLRPPEGQAESQPVRAFSPLDFTPPHASLTHWQPTLNGGELVLSARWAQAVATFAQLAEYDMIVRGFTLEPEGLQLRFTLQLEAANDT